MAKIVFYLSAVKGKANELLGECEAVGTAACITGNSVDIAILKPRSPDSLAVPPGSDFLATLDIVLEMVTPAGVPVESIKHELKSSLAPVLGCVDRDKSSLVSAHSRAFQESGPKPLRYHYLMYRRDDFSRADYLDYYTHKHYQFGIATPLADYYQNYTDIAGSAGLADLFGVQANLADSISELRFDDIDAYLSSDVIREVGPAAINDEAVFVNRERCQSFSMDVLRDTRDYEN